MTQYSPAQLVQLVNQYHPGQYPQLVINAVAVAWAESGGNTQAISPSHDYGLWQINQVHFGDGIINSSNWSSNAVQVAELWKLSAGLTNWAAWCTAWVNPVGNCGHGTLQNPQAGSPADLAYDSARRGYEQVFGPGGSTTSILPPQPEYSQWAYMQHYAKVTSDYQRRRIVAATNAIAGRFK